MKLTGENVKVFLLGALVALTMVFLMGAAGLDKEVGTYAVAGAGGDKGFGFILLDTTTGDYQIINPKDGMRGRFY